MPQNGAVPIKGIIGISMKIQIKTIKVIKPTLGKDLFGQILTESLGRFANSFERLRCVDLTAEYGNLMTWLFIPHFGSR
jgi:hypothetical protein